MLVAIAFAIAKSAMAIAFCLGLASSICVVWEARPLSDALPSIAVFAVCFVVRDALASLEGHLMEGFGDDGARSMLKGFLGYLFAPDASILRMSGRNSAVTEAVEGTLSISEYASTSILRFVDALAIPFAILICLFALDWVSGVIALVAYPFIIVYMKLIGSTAGDEAAKRHAEFERMSAAFADAANGVDTLAGFGAQRRFSKRIWQTSERFRMLAMRSMRIAMLSTAALDVFATLALAAVAIMLGFRLAEGGIGFLPALSVLVLVPEYFKPIRKLGADYHANLEGRESLNAMAALSREAEDAEDPMGADPLAAPIGKREGEKGIPSMVVDPSQHKIICLFGESGSGKTTLLNAIAGIAALPSWANVSACEGDAKIASFQSDAWRSRVSYIPQDAWLLSGTLRENLCLYSKDASEKAIEDAIEACNLNSLVERMPLGLETRIGEGGRSLSGGEASRVAFARALLDEGRDVIILDEPTAHLDAETESDVAQRIKALSQEKLVVMATHSLRVVEVADELVRLGPDIPASEQKPAEADAQALSETLQLRGKSGIAIPQADEEPQGQAPAKETLSWVARLASGNGWQLALALLLQATAILFAAGLMFTSGFMISLAAAIPLTVLALHLPSILVRIFGIGKPILQYAERIASHEWVLRMTSRLRRMLYDALASRSVALRSRIRLGGMLDLLTDGISNVQDLFLRLVIPQGANVLVASVMVIASFLFSPALGACAAIVCIAQLLVMPAICATVSRNGISESKELKLDFYTRLADDVSGATDIVLSGRSQEFANAALHDFDACASMASKLNGIRRVADVASSVLVASMAIATIAWATIAFSLDGSGGLAGALGASGSQNAPAYPPNWIAAFALCIFPLLEPLASSPSAAMDAASQMRSARSLCAFWRDGEDAKVGTARQIEGTRESHVAPSEGRESPDIAFQDITFAYPKAGQNVLEAFSWNVPYGSKIAISGASGIGKTTLASILRGERLPDSGRVIIGEKDVSDIRERMHEVISVMQQFPHIFDMSLRENLLIAKPDATDEELEHALCQAGLGDFLSSLEDGLDTQLQHSGMRASGGERQRISLARVLLADAPVLVLDEPFANLDMRTADQILRSILDACPNKTIILITHNPDVNPAFSRIRLV